MYYIINENASCEEPTKIIKLETKKELEDTILELTNRDKRVLTIIEGNELNYSIQHVVTLNTKGERV